MQTRDDRVDAEGEEIPPTKTLQVWHQYRHSVLEVFGTVLLVGQFVGMQHDLISTEQIRVNHRVRQEDVGANEAGGQQDFEDPVHQSSIGAQHALQQDLGDARV